MNNIIPPTNPAPDNQSPQQPPQDQKQDQGNGYPTTLTTGTKKYEYKAGLKSANDSRLTGKTFPCSSFPVIPNEQA